MPVQRNLDKYDFELFFELSPDFMCIAGYDGYFKKINSAVSKILGYSEEELFAKPINEFIYPEDREITSKHRVNLLNNYPLLNFENRYIGKNGDVIWLSWTSMPIEKDQIIYAVAKNITHKKLLEKDRNQLISNLTQINEDLKLINYTTSHDLRSPVNNLLSVFSLLNRSKIKDSETLQFLEILRSSTENLKSTLNNHLQILNQKESLQIFEEELTIEEELNAVIKSLNTLLQSSGTYINIDLSACKAVYFNRDYLRSIFLNLITNSIKYVKPGFAPTIFIQSLLENNQPKIIFKDEGRGFDMEKYKEKIFGLHQTFHNHLDSKGIGLYLVHQHLSNLGGSIQLESEVNQGAKFTLTFKALN